MNYALQQERLANLDTELKWRSAVIVTDDLGSSFQQQLQTLQLTVSGETKDYCTCTQTQTHTHTHILACKMEWGSSTFACLVDISLVLQQLNNTLGGGREKSYARYYERVH